MKCNDFLMLVRPISGKAFTGLYDLSAAELLMINDRFFVRF